MARRDRKQGLTLLAGLGIGAALMYVLDPQRGAARRARARDRGTSTLRTAGERVGGRARRLRDRATGAVLGRWNRRREGIVPDETLVARVRSHLWHHVQHPHAIEVTA
ncbi:MAG TPA: hypothetical protein VFY16_10115, partial [Gemmatimonadaceae bacterium]|nr:hypothetical protein [Gemmatimonadaceae bacterium]